MQKRIITHTVTTEIAFGDEGDLRRKIREVRTEFKKAINSHKAMKVLKTTIRMEK